MVIRTRCLFTNGYTLRDLLHPGDVMDLLHLAHNEGVPIFFDPGPSIVDLDAGLLAEVLKLSDGLLLTTDEARHLVAEPGMEAARALLDFGPAVSVVKEGSNGCYLATADTHIHHPGFDVAVVDTVGAGDAFAAAFVAAYLRQGSWQECAALANAMGAAVVATQGAGRCVPAAERLVELLGDDSAARLVRRRS